MPKFLQVGKCWKPTTCRIDLDIEKQRDKFKQKVARFLVLRQQQITNKTWLICCFCTFFLLILKIFKFIEQFVNKDKKWNSNKSKNCLEIEKNFDFEMSKVKMRVLVIVEWMSEVVVRAQQVPSVCPTLWSSTRKKWMSNDDRTRRRRTRVHTSFKYKTALGQGSVIYRLPRVIGRRPIHIPEPRRQLTAASMNSFHALRIFFIQSLPYSQYHFIN